jgi:hypothetical protein
MKSKTKKQTVPKWFKGMIYDQGEEVTNKYSNQTYGLNGLELSMYDFIMGTQWQMVVAPNIMTPSQVSDFRKALTWFRRNNPEAYMVLLD